MKNLIRAIDFSVDHNQLIEDTNRIMEKYPFNKENQICFQNYMFFKLCVQNLVEKCQALPNCR